MNKYKRFVSSSDDHAKHNGLVEVLRKLGKDEVDDEVGPMYECRSCVGTFSAFKDELKIIRG